jgi:DNA (cytosine-5)-methyltransferase 1
LASIKRTGPWNLSQLHPPKEDAPSVFSCFHCGGGSTMGYKLAGFRVLGGVEIDPQMMRIYRANHHPKHSFRMSVSDFWRLNKSELPDELFELDILDGSPPCSSFSLAGAREKKWGEKHKFREGQAHQVLDDLFFDFIEVAKMLQPRVVVAENVKGLVVGKARGYVRDIFRRFKKAGYECQLFLLDASRMGVPQKRQRTFFVARRIDTFAPLALSFSENIISVKSATQGLTIGKTHINPSQAKLWHKTKPGRSLADAHPRGHLWNHKKLHGDRPSLTLAATWKMLLHWSECRQITAQEAMRIQTFPDDFDFLDADPGYVCGMSVPPRMMQRVAEQVGHQWLGWPVSR